MQDAGSFFGGSGGLLVKQPKRVTPANRGAANAYVHGSSLNIPSRLAAGTYLQLPSAAGVAGASWYLRSASNGSAIASNAGPADGWLWSSFAYDWVNGFYYCLGKSGSTIQLYKINDTTGAQTAVSSAFAPATISNWAYSATWGHAYITGGNLKFICGQNGGGVVWHTVSLTTGAIVAQDQGLVLSDSTSVAQFSPPLAHVTADESAIFSATQSTYGGQVSVAFAKGGVVLPVAQFAFQFDAVPTPTRWIYNGESVTAVGLNGLYGWRYYDRNDFDRYVKAIIKAAAGV